MPEKVRRHRLRDTRPSSDGTNDPPNLRRIERAPPCGNILCVRWGVATERAQYLRSWGRDPDGPRLLALAENGGIQAAVRSIG